MIGLYQKSKRLEIIDFHMRKSISKILELLVRNDTHRIWVTLQIKGRWEGSRNH
jgi:hypothetical protein